MSENKFYSKFVEKPQKKKATKNPEKNNVHGEKKSAGKNNAPASSKSSGKNGPENSRPSKKTSAPKTARSSAKTHDAQKQLSTGKNSSSASYKKLSSLFNTQGLPQESFGILENFDQIIQSVRPLNSKQLQKLPDDIRSLSHQLTDTRNERRLGYMNENIQLTAYVRYYTWWNLVRLTRLFSNLPEKSFPKNDEICLDLGSGPLTVIISLWLSRPELRKLKLTWYCLDVSSNSMALGEDLYLSIAAKTGEEPWKIIRVKGSFGTALKQKASFITCANMINEMDQGAKMPPEYQTKKYFDQFNVYSTKDARFLLVEPGVPKAARTLSLLRERFIKSQKETAAPCPHLFECPMNGFKAYTGSKNKWCNFAFNTEDAPQKLLKLSELAKLPKERATLSFISAYPEEANHKENENLLCRITSDPFRLPSYKTGFYACSKLGLVLLSFKPEEAENLKSGDLLEVKIKTPDLLKTDEKSGAKIIQL